MGELRGPPHLRLLLLPHFLLLLFLLLRLLPPFKETDKRKWWRLNYGGAATGRKRLEAARGGWRRQEAAEWRRVRGFNALEVEKADKENIASAVMNTSEAL